MICMICEHEIEEGATVCPFCGARIDDAEEESLYQSFSEYEAASITTILFRERTGEEITIHTYPAVLGRSSRCDFRLTGNPAISGKHLSINRIGTCIYAEDLGSTNHTYADGQQIRKVCQLHSGMKLILADEPFTVTLIRNV